MKKLAIITTHPIQYNAPLFKLLSERKKIKIRVFYTFEQAKKKIFDTKFRKEIIWDIPLLEGYDFIFLRNIAKIPGSGHFKGCINPDLISEIKNWQADAILVYGWNHHSHFKAMRYFKGKIPVSFRGDSTLLDEKPNLKTAFRRIWLKFVYRYIDFAFYVGTNNKQYYLKHGLKANQLFFAPHAIDNERFVDSKEKKYAKQAQNLRSKLGFKKQEKVILFAGKFEPKKNLLFLIDVAKDLKKWRFLFVGNGKLEQKMKEKSANLPNVHFLPFQNQSFMPVVYRLADIFVLPSYNDETWGLAVNEAMACNLPIIVSDKVGCAIDLVKNNQNGFIFKSNNIQNLKEKINIVGNRLLNFGNESKMLIHSWNFEEIAKSFERYFINNN